MADAGCILQSLSDYLAPHDHIVPLDLGAKGRYGPCSFGRTFAHFPLVARLAVMSLQMLAVFACFGTAPFTALYLVLKSCFLTGPFSTN